MDELFSSWLTGVQFTDQTELTRDGWAVGPSGELLFWVPPMHRESLWRPSNVGVSGEYSTKINFDQFVHGESWAECFGG